MVGPLGDLTGCGCARSRSISRWAATGWVDWNLVVDITGGPNHLGNRCDANIVADPTNKLGYGTTIYQASYYYMGHFSRFLPAGSKRIDSQNSGELPSRPLRAAPTALLARHTLTARPSHHRTPPLPRAPRARHALAPTPCSRAHAMLSRTCPPPPPSDPSRCHCDPFPSPPQSWRSASSMRRTWSTRRRSSSCRARGRRSSRGRSTRRGLSSLRTRAPIPPSRPCVSTCPTMARGRVSTSTRARTQPTRCAGWRMGMDPSGDWSQWRLDPSGDWTPVEIGPQWRLDPTGPELNGP